VPDPFRAHCGKDAKRHIQSSAFAAMASSSPDPYAVVRAQNAAASRKSTLPMQSAKSGNSQANAPHKFAPV